MKADGKTFRSGRGVRRPAMVSGRFMPREYRTWTISYDEDHYFRKTLSNTNEGFPSLLKNKRKE
jgi:hypothetical protein